MRVLFVLLSILLSISCYSENRDVNFTSKELLIFRPSTDVLNYKIWQIDLFLSMDKPIDVTPYIVKGLKLNDNISSSYLKNSTIDFNALNNKKGIPLYDKNLTKAKNISFLYLNFVPSKFHFNQYRRKHMEPWLLRARN